MSSNITFFAAEDVSDENDGLALSDEPADETEPKGDADDDEDDDDEDDDEDDDDEEDDEDDDEEEEPGDGSDAN